MGGLNGGIGKAVGAALASDATDAEPLASDAFGPLLLLERFAAAPSPILGIGATGWSAGRKVGTQGGGSDGCLGTFGFGLSFGRGGTNGLGEGV